MLSDWALLQFLSILLGGVCYPSHKIVPFGLLSYCECYKALFFLISAALFEGDF
jgi:hypothetical protein